MFFTVFTNSNLSVSPDWVKILIDYTGTPFYFNKKYYGTNTERGKKDILKFRNESVLADLYWNSYMYMESFED